MNVLILIIIVITAFAIVREFALRQKDKTQSIEAQRKQFISSNSKIDIESEKEEQLEEEDSNSLVDDFYEDIKENPDDKDNWLGFTEQEIEEIYYRLKADKVYLSDEMYKYVSNIIGEQYEEDLIEELQYVDEYSISEWIDEKRREKLFLSSRVWRKIKTIQRKNY